MSSLYLRHLANSTDGGSTITDDDPAAPLKPSSHDTTSYFLIAGGALAFLLMGLLAWWVRNKTRNDTAKRLQRMRSNKAGLNGGNTHGNLNPSSTRSTGSAGSNQSAKGVLSYYGAAKTTEKTKPYSPFPPFSPFSWLIDGSSVYGSSSGPPPTAPGKNAGGYKGTGKMNVGSKVYKSKVFV